VVGFLLLVASAVLLTGGSELFAEHASAAGQRFGVTALAIGLVLAGAEPEEMVPQSLLQRATYRASRPGTPSAQT